ncbi:FAD dependent oxidoreductase [Thelephora terrestris]|uniref:FAD dependent oxidoreductase n=1 Tax=Thelephora terrestris TaxID=56493 RepID=A0A9P6HIS2_9AGAM|nr:FAD dependent oxidoreductase [Thelephora terrestris]
MTKVEPGSPIVIVGAGCFGLSTAYHLLKRGFTDVNVLDRAETLPAKDAASTDMNKIVRSSYPDDFYTSLAKDAVKSWKDEDEWGKHYHEAGVLIMGEGAAGYTKASYANDLALGVRVVNLEDEEKRKSVFDSGVELGTAFTNKCFAYLNQDAGWVHAEGGTRRALENVRALGGTVTSGKAVAELVRESGETGRTTAVRCTDGSLYPAELVVLATGSWTPSTFPESVTQFQCLATGHSVVTIQLTFDEAILYRKSPVIYNQTTGFYIFPPNAENIVKMAIHAGGHTRDVRTDQNCTISTPRTVSTHGVIEGCRIPVEAARELRRAFREIYPALASSKPFVTTRMCWYADTQDEDWLIGPAPGDPSLFVATGGSGHAYKFLPVIGRLVADAVQGVLPENLAKKFAVDRKQQSDDKVNPESVLRIERRINTARTLDEGSLSTDKDLLPT